MNQREPTNLGGLEALVASVARQSLPPVDSWNPPYCGDIGLRIRRDGSWLYQNSPIGRTALVKLFASVLRRDSDGKHYLVTPVEKILVAVDDAPFLAVEMIVTGHGSQQQLAFRTNVDDVVVCEPHHPIRFEIEPGSGGLKPYVLVRGRLEALVSRAVYYDLMTLSAEHPTKPGLLGLWSSNSFYEFPGAF
jgi:uncharacterized protein